MHFKYSKFGSAFYSASLRGFVLSLVSLVCGSGMAHAFPSTQLFLKRAVIANTLEVGARDHFSRLTDSGAQNGNAPVQTIIQFNEVVTAADQKSVRAAGLRIQGYVPDNALLVTGSFKNTQALLKQNPKIQAVVPFQSEWKISEEFGARSVFNQDQTKTVQVRLVRGERAESLLPAIQSMGAKVVASSPRALFVSVTLKQLNTLAAEPVVEWIQPAPQVQTMMMDLGPAHVESRLADGQLSGYESGTRVMKFEPAWARGYNGKGQMVAMADTGLDTGKLDSILVDYKDAVVGGVGVGYYSEGWGDPQGHGTHVTGSVISNGSMSNGLIRGGAWGAKYYAESLWSPIMDNIMVPASLGSVFQTAYDQGARVHTNSWGAAANFGTYDNMAAQVDDFLWSHPDMLILFAAGNSGVDKNKDGVIDPNSVSSPGTSKNALTVGASENFVSVGGRQEKLSTLRNGTENWGVEPLASDTLSNNPEGVACFSSRGPTTDGRLKPEIVAPGTNILSGRSRYPNATVLWGAYNDYYVWAGGTSMATPLTAGAAAVTRQFLVEKMKVTNPSGAMVKATLMHAAHDMFPGQYGAGAGQEIPTRRPNTQEGYGRVDMDAVTSLDGISTQVVDDAEGVATGETKTLNAAVGPDGLLHATLVYTDAPGLTSTSKALVNDLALEVRDASGKVVRQADTHVDNNESIELSGLTPGAYVVAIVGTNVPQGHKNNKQPYALLITSRAR